MEKAVEGFLHGLPSPWFVDPTHAVSHADHHSGIIGQCLELFRVVVLLIMPVRFYFGAVWLSHQHLLSRGRKNVDPKDAWRRARYYRNDFVTGIFHFALFFAWSLTITIHQLWLGFLSPYLIFLGLILVWDLFYPWRDFQDYIKRNLKTAGVSLGLLVFLRLVWGPDGQPWAEAAALLPVLGISLWEIRKHLEQAITEYPSL